MKPRFGGETYGHGLKTDGSCSQLGQKPKIRPIGPPFFKETMDAIPCLLSVQIAAPTETIVLTGSTADMVQAIRAVVQPTKD